MSRSYKKPITKDPKYKDYWKIIRRVTKMAVKQGKEPKNPRTIINDYDYIDWIRKEDNLKIKKRK